VKFFFRVTDLGSKFIGFDKEENLEISEVFREEKG